MSSIGRELSRTFKDIVGDITGVLSMTVILGVLMIVLPLLLQVNKLVSSLSGLQVPQVKQPTQTQQGVKFVTRK